MCLTEEFLTYESDRAVTYLQRKKLPYSAYGSARNCRAVFANDTWNPAPVYHENGSIDQGVDVILYPIIQNNEVTNIVAFEPKKPLKLYSRVEDHNLWSMLDLISALGEKA